MDKRITGLSGILLATLLAWFSACDVNDPDRFLRPPIIKSYSPGSATLNTAVGDTMRFAMAAIDPDDKSLQYSFVLGDSVTSQTNRWMYVVDDTGDVDVVGRVTNGVADSRVRWHLTRIWPVNLPPEIVYIEPPDPEITIVLGASIEFAISARDPENRALSYVYTADDTIVAVTRRFTYNSRFVGLVEIKAIVTDGETFASNTWMLRIAAEPDSVLPARVVVTSLKPGAATGEIDVEWTAVGDDGMDGLPAHYIVRTSGQPITDEYAWSSASDRPGEPDPGPPGSTQNMVISQLPPAQLVYVAVRAMDDFGNMSEISAPVGTRSRGMKFTGTVRDAVTEAPIPNIVVRLLSSVDTTDADGLFRLSELPAGYGQLYFWDEFSAGDYGDYFDVIYQPFEIRDNIHLNMWLLPNIELDTDDYSNFLQFFYQMTRLDAPDEDVLGTWKTPCRVYVPPLVTNNLDYEQTIKGIFQEWEELVDVDLWEFVDAVPDTGVFVDYLANDVSREHYLVTDADRNGAPIQGKISLRTIHADTTLSTFQVIIRHEVGHAMGMNHSTDPYHIMVGGRWPIAAVQSADEIKLARAMYRIPRYSNLGWFKFN